MDILFDNNLITTKDAAEIFGYSSGYLGRLARSGKISAKRIGHIWLIDKESLKRFVDTQGNRKIDYARALSRAREKEYLLHQNGKKGVPYYDSLRRDVPDRSLTIRLTKALTHPILMSEIGIEQSSFFSQAIAITVSLFVVACGAFAASGKLLSIPGVESVTITEFAHNTASLAQEVAFGFGATFGDIPFRVVTRIDEIKEKVRSRSMSVATDFPSLFAESNFVLPQIVSFENSSTTFRSTALLPKTILSSDSGSAVDQKISLETLTSSASSLSAFLTTPAHLTDTLADAYLAIGTHAYSAILESLFVYRALIESSGEETLSLATSARDTFARAPNFISGMNLALGNAVINTTHALIHADVVVAYGIAEAAPESARTTYAFVGNIGNILAHRTSQMPALATTFFLRTTELPATLGPGLAQAIFSTEYLGATHFVALAYTVSDSYLSLVENTGYVTYAATHGAVTLGRVVQSQIAEAPAVFEDVLAMFDKNTLTSEGLTFLNNLARATARIPGQMAGVFAHGTQ